MSEVVLRPEVRKFAEQMELKLRTHDKDRGPQGWLKSDVYWLASRILIEQRELVKALLRWPQDIEAVASECADVANFAMMVSDVVFRYGVQGRPPGAPIPASPEEEAAIQSAIELLKEKRPELLGIYNAGYIDGHPTQVGGWLLSK